MPGPYDGKRGLVLGVANRRSIAWAIAKRLADGGAELAFTYQGERIEKNVRDLAETVNRAGKKPLSFDYQMDATGHFRPLPRCGRHVQPGSGSDTLP